MIAYTHQIMDFGTHLKEFFIPVDEIVVGASNIVKAFVALEIAHRLFRHLVFGHEHKRLAKAAAEYNRKQAGNKQKKNDICNPQDIGGETGAEVVEPTIHEALAIRPLPRIQLAKTAAQYAHFVANSVLAFTGIYYWFFSGLPTVKETTLVERLSEFNDCGIFGTNLIAYNLWSTYVSYTVWGEEEFIMTLHHASASVIGFVVTFAAYGWRYYSSFFFGVVELSSLPLSIMNIYKFRPDWRTSMSGIHNIMKALFVFSFLTIRVGVWIPVFSKFLGDCYALLNSPDAPMSVGFRFVLVTSSAVPGLFLTGLQLFWGFRILLIIHQIIMGVPKAEKKS